MHDYHLTITLELSDGNRWVIVRNTYPQSCQQMTSAIPYDQCMWGQLFVNGQWVREPPAEADAKSQPSSAIFDIRELDT